MSSSSYWDSQIDYYLSNQPPSSSSYYNKDFVSQINKARANIDNLVAEKDKSWAAAGQKQDDYNAFHGSMSTYGEVYTQSKSQFGIEEHRDDYEKSKKALALAESTLSALPSSINASSNRVLTQQQRENRYNILADKYMGYRDNLQAKTSAYEEVWKKAREEQETWVKGEIAEQYSKLGQYNSVYTTAIDEFMRAGERLSKGKEELFKWESEYSEWQDRQYEYERDIWLKNLNAALTRYSEAIKTELAVQEAEYQKARADREALRASNERNAKNRLAQGLVDSYYAGKRAKSNVYQQSLGLASLNWY